MPGTARNWDLYLCPYQPLAAQEGLDFTVGDVIAGPKWSGLRELLNNWTGWRNYAHIWLPDDDEPPQAFDGMSKCPPGDGRGQHSRRARSAVSHRPTDMPRRPNRTR